MCYAKHFTINLHYLIIKTLACMVLRGGLGGPEKLGDPASHSRLVAGLGLACH